MIRLAAVCTNKQRAAVLQEASQLVDWALCFVDWRVVDEAIGWSERADVKPRRPRALAGKIRERAEQYGVHMPVFRPEDAGSI
jgi:hypothetical protein